MLTAGNSDCAAALTASEKFMTALYLGPGLETFAKALSGDHATRLAAFTTPAAEKALFQHDTETFRHAAIHQSLLSDKGGRSALQDFNISGHASLRPATGLRQIFPGLRETKQINVETIDSQKMLESAALEGAHNLLILGATGFEMETLDAALTKDGPPIFSRIILLLPSLALYRGSHDGAALAERLEQASYRCVWKDASDPDLPIAAFDIDRIRLADRAALAQRDRDIAVLNDRLERFSRDLDDIRGQRDTAQRNLAAAKTAHEAARAEAQEQERARLDELQASLTAVQKEKDSAIDARVAAETQRAELKAQLRELKSEHDAALKKAEAQEQLQATLAAVQKKKDSAVEARVAAETRRAELEAQLRELKPEHDAALKKTEDALALSLRLQALREADLSELQTRYQALKNENDHLSDLLRKVLHNLDFLQERKRRSEKKQKRS